MKKFVCALLSVALILSMVCSVAMAAPKKNNNATDPDVEAYVAMANARIQSLVDYAISTPEDDVKEMQAQIKAIVKDVKAYAKAHNAKIGCNYVTYVIDGHTVKVDPLYVVNIRQ